MQDKLAGFLLQIKAIKLNVQKPFTWASGIRSPIYCDNRITLSYPEIRDYIKDQFIALIKEKYGQPDLIAGVATGGIAQGALIADALKLPFVYVRSSKKTHGLSNQIEGIVEPGQRVVVIEDLVSTGGSSLHSVQALRDSGAKVTGMCAIFTYGLEEAKNNFMAANCTLNTLTDIHALLEQAMTQKYITTEELRSIREWHKNPVNWQQE